MKYFSMDFGSVVLLTVNWVEPKRLICDYVAVFVFIEEVCVWSKPPFSDLFVRNSEWVLDFITSVKVSSFFDIQHQLQNLASTVSSFLNLDIKCKLLTTKSLQPSSISAQGEHLKFLPIKAVLLMRR